MRHLSLLLLLLLGCRTPPPSSTLEEYAAQLPTASAAGPHVRTWVEATASASLPPDERLFRVYEAILASWKHVPDPLDSDTFGNAETLIASGKLEGDCEDCCAVLVAACRVIGLTSRVCLGEADGRGHAWVEVSIQQSDKLDPAISQRVRSRFGDSVGFVERSGSWWLQLSPDGSLNAYRATHAITADGKLIALKK